jgi:hypothetical protein
MKRFYKFLPLFVATVLLSVSPALAIEPIPAESGFSGYLSIGGGFNYHKNIFWVSSICLLCGKSLHSNFDHHKG